MGVVVDAFMGVEMAGFLEDRRIETSSAGFENDRARQCRKYCHVNSPENG